jgi:hypothetical protein
VSYDLDLANRVRELLAQEEGLTEVPMFGGLAFLLDGNMAVAVSSRGGILVRVGSEPSAQELAGAHAGVARMGRRTMKGWIHVLPEGLQSKRRLATWVTRGVTFTRTLPPKG